MIKTIFNERYELSTQGAEVTNQVRIEDIIQDDNFNPRSETDNKIVDVLMTQSYIPAIKLAYFPELSDKLIIVDGNHRYTSRVNNGSDKINAIIYEFTDELELFKEATIANLSHGVMLNREDRISALAKLISAAKRVGGFVAAKLSRDLGGVDERELRKISSWTRVVDVVGIDTFGYNISKGDVFCRLLTVGEKTDEEFKELYNQLKDLTFSDLQEAVKKILKGEELSVMAMAMDKVNEEGNVLESLICNLDEIDLNDCGSYVEEIAAEYVEESDDIFADDEVKAINIELDFKIYSIEQRLTSGCSIKGKKELTIEIKSMKEKISKLEKLLCD